MGPNNLTTLTLESEPVDPGLPRLQPLRRDGEPCFFTEQLTKLVVQLGTLALRFLLPGQSHTSEVFPPNLPCLGTLLPKLRFLVLQDSHLRLDTFARLRKCGDIRARLFQPGAESRQLLGHHRLTFQRSPLARPALTQSGIDTMSRQHRQRNLTRFLIV